MEHQDWSRKVYDSKNKNLSDNLQNKVLTDKDIKTIVKPKSKGTDGKTLHKILESESLAVPVSSHELKAALLQARNAKGLKQKDLAFQLGVKETVLSSWESGKAVPDNTSLQKMEKILECKLPRPPKIKL